METPKNKILSIVILAYNRKEEVVKTVKYCLENLYLKEKSEIIVVDNCSDDGTLHALNHTYSNAIKLIRTEKNIGVAGWNKGFEIAQGKYVFVLDDDSNAEEGIEKAIDFLERNVNVGVLALKIAGRGSEQITYTLPDLHEWIGFTGCGAIIRKEVIEKIGGFSEWLFIYEHEFEYGIRVINAGYKIVLFKNCIINHRSSALNRTDERLATFAVRNDLLIVDKYFSKNRTYSFLKVKINSLCNCLSKFGIESFPYVLKGFKMFEKDRKKIPSDFVSPGAQTIFQYQFLHGRSLLWMTIFSLPKALLSGLIITMMRYKSNSRQPHKNHKLFKLT